MSISVKTVGQGVKIVQPPYRAKTLLPNLCFISHCRDHDVNIDRQTLETLHQLGVLMPALKVDVGIVEFRRIYAGKNGRMQWIFVDPDNTDQFGAKKMDIRMHYHTGSLVTRTDRDWLTWYEEHNMVSIPAKEPFAPWEYPFPDFTPDPEEATGGYVYLYDQRQFFVLKMIEAEVGSRALRWGTIDAHKIPMLKEAIADLYTFLAFYIEVEERNERWNRDEKLKIYNDFLQQSHREWEAKKDWEANFKEVQLPRLKQESEALISKYGYTIDDVKRWRRFLAKQSFILDPEIKSRRVRRSLRWTSEHTLINTEDCCYMIHILNRFLFLLTGQQDSIHAILCGIEGSYARCVICQHYFTPDPRTKDPKTCSKPCRREQMRRASRNWRARKPKKNIKTDS